MFSQSGPAKRALKALAENDLEKASEFILKGLEKDSLDPLVYYNIARFQVQKPDPAPDSANHTEIKARDLFGMLMPDDQEKYARNGLSLISLDVLRLKIDSLAFEHALSELSEEGFIHFLNEYSGASQRARAAEFRDSLAYVSARNENTYQSYRNFMDKYPEASQVSLASERYERLFFEEATADGKLSSYEAFLAKNPATPYRSEVEWTIFSMSLPTPDPNELRNFLQRFRNRPVSTDIRNYLYYSLREKSQLDAMPEIWNDSLRRIHQMNTEMWIATFEKDRTQFIDASGDDKFSIDRDALSADYQCEVLSTDFIIGISQIYSRQGNRIYEGDFTSAVPAKMGFILLNQENKFGLITAWGREVLPMEFEEIEVFESGMIKARRRNGWDLYSFTGRQLTNEKADDIQYVEGLYIVSRKDQAAFLSATDIQPALEADKIIRPDYIDDYELLNEHIWIRIGNKEGLLDFNLNAVIEVAPQRVEPLEAGILVRKPDETIVYSASMLQKFQTTESLLAYNDQYIRFSAPETEGLFDITSFRFVALPDSARLLGNYGALAFLREGFAIYQYGREVFRSREKVLKTAVLENNGTEWVILQQPRYAQLLTSESLVRLPDHDNISLLTDSLFILSRAGRKTLIDARGKDQLSGAYQGMANFDGRDLSLLRNGKFGVYRPAEKMLIPASYEKMLTAYGDYYFVAVKDGRKGLIDKSNKTVIPYAYDEIIYWNDTLIFGVDKNTYKFHVVGGDVLPENIFTSYRILRQDASGKIIMAFKDDHFGVYSSQDGEVLPATFDDVVDLGNGGKPCYFTETYVEQADLHVIVYYSSDGRILKKQAMEPSFFSDIYCDE
ncbi:WG repeat-containing protein [Fulvivirga sp. 1062]|uniref:WG repeat-containing protein n=1 Tax=Fulvivirga sedimenti TaxID=2879465 RepID=A0A9X1KWK2_9BACT|nr:WG repeat-containing protein [Fulvivirga sedimenti]